MLKNKIEVYDYNPKYLINNVEYIGKHELSFEEYEINGEKYSEKVYKYDNIELALEIINKAFPEIDIEKFESVPDSWECGDHCCSGSGLIFSYNGNGEKYIEDYTSIEYYIEQLLSLANIDKNSYELINHGQIFEE